MGTVVLDALAMERELENYRVPLEHNGMTLRDVIRLAIEAWVEVCKPRKFPAEYSADSVVYQMVADERPHADDLYLQLLYEITERAYFIVDERMASAINFHAVVGAEFGGFLGSDGVYVRLIGGKVLRRQ